MNEILHSKQIRLHILALWINTFILRISWAVFTELFVLTSFVALAFALLLLSKRKIRLNNYRRFFTIGALYALNFLLFVIIVLYSEQAWSRPLMNEVFTGFASLGIFIVVYLMVNNIEELQRLVKTIATQYVMILTTIVIILFLKSVLFVAPANTYDDLLENFSFGKDYNLFSLSIIIAICIILYRMRYNARKRTRYAYWSLLSLFLSVQFVQFSRRGMVITMVILFVLLSVHILYLFFKWRGVRNFIQNTRVPVIIILLFGASLTFFTVTLSGKDRSRVMNALFDHADREKLIITFHINRFLPNRYGDIHEYLWINDSPKLLTPIVESLFPPIECSVELISDPRFLKKMDNWYYWTSPVSKSFTSYPRGHCLTMVTNSNNEGITQKVLVNKYDRIVLYCYVQVHKYDPYTRFMYSSNALEGKYKAIYINQSWEGDSTWHMLSDTLEMEWSGLMGIWIGGGGKTRAALTSWTSIHVVQNPCADDNIYEPPPHMQAQATTIPEPHFINQSGAGAETAAAEPVALPAETKRLAKIKYAISLFKSYTLKDKLFGKGFWYLRKYSSFFKVKYDYPHNPIVSVLLYSGITGVLVMAALFVQIVFLYIRHLKKTWPIVAIFVIVMVFGFSSGNTLFSLPPTLCLIIFPLLYELMKSDSLKG